MENGHVIAMDRKNNEPEVKIRECANCFKDIEGSALLGFDKPIDGLYFCDQECMQEHLMEFLDYEEVKI